MKIRRPAGTNNARLPRKQTLFAHQRELFPHSTKTLSFSSKGKMPSSTDRIIHPSGTFRLPPPPSRKSRSSNRNKNMSLLQQEQNNVAHPKEQECRFPVQKKSRPPAKTHFSFVSAKFILSPLRQEFTPPAEKIFSPSRVVQCPPPERATPAVVMATRGAERRRCPRHSRSPQFRPCGDEARGAADTRRTTECTPLGPASEFGRPQVAVVTVGYVAASSPSLLVAPAA